jgi:ubiquinone/menaquinone biosynthesis C-methylase UbiE
MFIEINIFGNKNKMIITENSQEEELNKKSFFSTEFIDPQKVIGQLDLVEGMTIADFGSGAGYFTLPLAQKISNNGTVYALDVILQKLEAVAGKARTQGLNNVITKRVNLENEGGSGLEKESIDFVIMKDMLFQNKNKSQILEEARRVLKTGGRILIIEWNSENFSIGPEKKLRIYKESIIELAKKKNLEFLNEINAGTFHYGIIFKAI